MFVDCRQSYLSLPEELRVRLSKYSGPLQEWQVMGLLLDTVDCWVDEVFSVHPLPGVHE